MDTANPYVDPSFDPTATFPAGCASGSADRARCLVVGIELPDNNLITKQLPRSLFFDLPHLQSLNLANNSISGQLPVSDLGALSLLSFDLTNNDFEYPPPLLVQELCLSGKMVCPGYPPYSCRAFSKFKDFVVAADSPTACVECGPKWVSTLALIGFSSLFVLLLSAYLFCITQKQSSIVKDGMSTVSIFITHLQTIDIVSKMRLSWPISTEAVFRMTIVNGLTFEAARPECLSDRNSQVPFFYLLSLVKVSLPIFLLLTCSFGRSVLQFVFRRQWIRRSTSRQQKIIDKLVVVETVVFQFQLCSSWRNSYLLIRSMNPGGSSEAAMSQIALAGGVLAFVLVSLQTLYLIKYAVETYAMVLAQRAKQAGESPHGTNQMVRSRALRITLDRFGHGQLSADRLKERTSFIGKRFGDHAPFWQFAVWARQALIMMIVLLPSIFGIDETLGQITSSLNVTDLTREERLQVEQQRDYERVLLHMVRAAQTVATLVVIFVFAWWTWRIKPFHRHHQNWLELWLIMSCAGVIALAFVYTIFVVQLSQAQALALEITLTSVLVLTTVAAAAYLIIHYRREVARMSKHALERARSSITQGRGSVSRASTRLSQGIRRRNTQVRASVFFRTSSGDPGTRSVSVIDSDLDEKSQIAPPPGRDPALGQPKLHEDGEPPHASRDDSMEAFLDSAARQLRTTPDPASYNSQSSEDNLLQWMHSSKPPPPSSTPPPPKPELPEGWEEFMDVKFKTSYYYNVETGETSWVRPAAQPSAPSLNLAISLSHEEFV